jgi:TfoX/Sxy family transcriptional regulator of competence genes
MATQQATVDDLLDRLAGAGPVTARKMFGEYCVYLNGKPVALVCDDTLYFKPTAAGRELMPDAAEGPPYPGAKPHLILRAEEWADHKALCRLVRATFAGLPKPKPRKKPAAPGAAPGRGRKAGRGR